ncbi:MAG: nucleotidyltransferase family protein [Bryobacteraceae bacterium]|nr:nucleotidyltransferase family protein [Solibacteraceae bacterium]MCL4841212.1 nucleotidyltransferase family protein [Bryobacteraceae bacterium]MCO5353568.1 nucleotidyltransferase family protein [Bryobacteraceae bacterium]
MKPENFDLAAVVLAGGASSRMGRPKALLEYQGETFLDRLVRLFSAHCSYVCAVLGYDAEQIARGMTQATAPVLVLNPHPERGQLSSLQCGLRSLPPAISAAFFHPVDIPGVSESTIARLAEEWTAAPTGTLVLQPAHDGQKGHPVLVARAVISELLTLPAGTTAREVLHRRAAQTLTVEVTDPRIRQDTDTPEEYQRLRAGESTS